MKAEKENRKNLMEWLSVFANIATIIGLVIGVSFCIKISNNITNSIQNNIDLNSSSKTMEEELIDAQTYYKGGQYEAAKNIYLKWKNSSDIAKVNLGYMYSNGYGVDQNLQEASKYYSQAYNQGNEVALTNYLYIHLYKPTSYEETIAALRVGYNSNNEETIKFLAFFMTGELNSKYDDALKTIAIKFWDLSLDKQKELLSKQMISSKEYFQKETDETLPKNTDFKKYNDVDNILTRGINRYIEVYKQETESIIWVPVYDINTYYVKESFRFLYSDLLFSESMIVD